MPIIERTPRECFLVFTEHLRGLIAATVTRRYPIREVPGERRMMIGFREDTAIAVPIETHYGRLHFYLGQALEAEEEDGGFRLRTRQYWYRVQHEPSLKTKAVLRWEYDSTTGRKDFARHHVQMPAGLAIGTGELDLDKAHVPTGWVTIEEVIRFLIVDLGMSPPCGETWPDALEESERKFYEDFTGKRHKPPRRGDTGDEG